MSWFRVDDDVFEHRKFVGVSDAAVGLWLRGGTFATKYRTDGFLSREVVRAKRWPKKRIDELVRHQIWEVVDGGYRIHDFLHYQPDHQGRLPPTPTRRVDPRLSQVRADAGRRGAEARWHDKRGGTLLDDDDKPDGSSDPKCQSGSVPVPSTVPEIPGPRLPVSPTKTNTAASFTAAGPVFQSLLDVLKPR